MDPQVVDRLAAVDRRVLWGLIEEHIATTAAGDAGWEQDWANWVGVQRALDRAVGGAQPARLRDEPPRWLRTATRTSLGQAATVQGRGSEVMTIRLLERLGLIEVEHDDAYVLAFVGGIAGESRADVLRADHELRESIIWRLFEVEGGGEVSLANVDKFCRSESSRWSATFHELVGDGALPRGAVLSAALAALARDFSAYRAGWYSRLYQSFDPTPAESAERQSALRHLLRSTVTTTVTFAMRCLVAVGRAGLLDDDEAAPSLGPALRHGNRSTADAALGLADGITRRRPDLSGVVAAQVAAALTHPHPEVQQRAARLLLALGAGDHAKEHAADMFPAVTAALGFGGTGDLPPEAPKAVASDIRASLPADAAPAPVVRPVDGPELVEVMAALLEDASDAAAVESVLAGLARTGATGLLAPLDKRAATILERGPRPGVNLGWLRGQLARLVRRSAGHAVPPLPWAWDVHDAPPGRQVSLRFLARRIAEVGEIAAGAAEPADLVATPEHPAGWIRPETLVTRMAGTSATAFDLVAGILRLAPEGRHEALATLDRDGLPGDPRLERVLRHALGGVQPGDPQLERRLDAQGMALWTAAARARSPLGVDGWAASLGLTGSGRAEPLDLRIGVPQPWDGDTSDVRDEDLPWIVVASPVVDGPDAQPTALGGYEHDLLGWGDAEDFLPWVATVFPADAEHLAWVGGTSVLLRALPYVEVQHDAARVLDALRVHEGRLGPLTHAVLVAGLSAAGIDERVHAVDAVSRLGSTGQLAATGLAEGIVAVGPTTPLPRLAGSLRDLAASGPAGNALVVDALAQALASAPVTARGVHALLEVLLDEVIRTGRPTPPHLAPWLAQLRGTSRAAALAAGLRQRL